MFKASAPVPVELPAVEPCTHPVPLSELERELGGVPADGWAAFLGRRGVAMIPDDLGRDSVSRSAARQLLDERRADLLRRQQHLKLVEAEAIERDREWRASLPRGLSADAFADGASYGELVAAAELAGRPKRLTPLEEAFTNSGETVTFHAWPSEE